MNAKLTALSQRLQKQKATATPAEQSAIIALQRDITFAKKSSDLTRKEAALKDLQARAKQIAQR